MSDYKYDTMVSFYYEDTTRAMPSAYNITPPNVGDTITYAAESTYISYRHGPNMMPVEEEEAKTLQSKRLVVLAVNHYLRLFPPSIMRQTIICTVKDVEK